MPQFTVRTTVKVYDKLVSNWLPDLIEETDVRASSIKNAQDRTMQRIDESNYITYYEDKPDQFEVEVEVCARYKQGKHTKAEIAKLTTALDAVIYEEMGGCKTERNWEVPTDVGGARIINAGDQVYVQFDDPALANTKLAWMSGRGFNNYTGKYNCAAFLHRRDYTIVECVELFRAHMGYVMGNLKFDSEVLPRLAGRAI